MKPRKKAPIYCCGCQKEVSARLTNGAEIYPNRSDLFELPFWRCDICKNYVGCHHKTSKPARPLGNIPTPELRKARGHIHKLIDPIWKSKMVGRGKLYQRISDAIGYQFHTAEIKTIDDARDVYKAARLIVEELKASEGI